MNLMWGYVYVDGKVVKKKVPIPVLRENEVLVKIEKVSLCGSDFHIFNNDDWARETISNGIVIGHEGCGVVVELGAKVKRVKEGEFVALESHYACKQCESENLNADHCPHFGVIGVHGSSYGKDDIELGGVFSEFVALPEYCCYPVQPEIYQELSPSLLEPAGNSWEIARFLKKRGLPDSIAIFGCGPHGLNLQLFCRHLGIKSIVAFETDSWRLEFAKQFGAAHHIIHPERVSPAEIRALIGEKDFDVAIDMVGNIQVVETCKSLVRNHGLVILFGLPRHEAFIAHGENFAEIIFNNETLEVEAGEKTINLRGFTGRSRETWMELLNALEKSSPLRNKLARPLHFIGSLHSLEMFLVRRPLHFLKVGMTGFT